MTAGTPRPVPAADWTLRLDGEVEHPVVLDWQGFQSLPQQKFVVDLYCVTRWSRLETRWRGVSIDALVRLARPRAGAAYVLAVADGGYTTNLRLCDLTGERAFVATGYNGLPLAIEHGGPARLVVPGLYFWKSARWLRGLHFGPFDNKGFWEKLGYHDRGDPWKEQRFRE